MFLKYKSCYTCDTKIIGYVGVDQRSETDNHKNTES